MRVISLPRLLREARILERVENDWKTGALTTPPMSTIINGTGMTRLTIRCIAWIAPLSMDTSIILVRISDTGSCESIHTVIGSGFRAASISKLQPGIGQSSPIGVGIAVMILLFTTTRITSAGICSTTCTPASTFTFNIWECSGQVDLTGISSRSSLLESVVILVCAPSILFRLGRVTP